MVSRRGVGGEQLLAIAVRQPTQPVERRGYRARDLREGDLAGEKRRNCALVGGVENRRRGAAGLSSSDSQAQRRKALVIYRLVSHWRQFNRIERRHAVVLDPFGVRESIENGKLHRWNTHLRNDAAIYELDE